MTHTLVIAFVDDVDSPRLRRLAAEIGAVAEAIICADSGADAALAWGLRPTLALGDMDSITAATLAALHTARIPVRTFLAEKDETDLELALRAAVDGGATQITLLGGIGGRLDHTLGNLFLLAASWLAGLRVTIESAHEQIVLLRAGESITLTGTPGDVVSLVPFSATVDGIRTDGLYYPLNDESLALGPSRGISNVLVGTQASVFVAAGLLLVIHNIV